MTAESRMKIKGKVVDYALLIAVGVGLIWCLYEAFITPEVSPVLLVVLVLAFVLYVVSLPKRNRQIQSSMPKKEAEDKDDISGRKVNRG